MAYVIGKLEGRISGGKISGEIRDLVLHEGPRPKTAYEFGADPTQIERLNSRTPGSINTLVRLGVGCALVARGVENLTWLDERQMEKFKEKVGELNGAALLGARRNIQAGGTWLCQDICAGVLEEADLMAGAIRELVEVGLYSGQKWAKYVLPALYDIYQDVIDEEQKETWQLAGLYSGMGLEVSLARGLAYDQVNGIDCLVAAEPNVGSMEFIIVFKVTLPKIEGGWKMIDLETGFSPVNNKTFLLNRQPLGIFPRKVGRPVQLGFGPNCLDLNYPIVVLDYDNLRMNTNAKVQIVLNRLGWL